MRTFARIDAGDLYTFERDHINDRSGAPCPLFTPAYNRAIKSAFLDLSRPCTSRNCRTLLFIVGLFYLLLNFFMTLHFGVGSHIS